MKKNKTVHSLLSALMLIGLSLFGLHPVPATSAEFIHLDLLGNSLPSAKCSAQEQAKSRASSESELNRYARVFCETQGYGWYVDQRKSDGTVVCNECGDKPGLYQCHLEDIRVTCKRLKPGSTGLFPGKG